MLRITLAVIHLLALAIGSWAVIERARSAAAIATSRDAATRMLAADSLWGMAALLWIGTGVWRALAGTEKASVYYWSNTAFMVKMALLALILVLESWPIVKLVQWRIAAARRAPLPVERQVAIGRRVAAISRVEALLVVGMIVAAVMTARGFGTAG